jgi:putative redox protein
MTAEVLWRGGLQFSALAGGHEIQLDGDQEAGSSPMELLLESLAACMAIDVVLILQKKRVDLKEVKTRIEGTRAEGFPKRFVSLRMHFELSGSGIKPPDVERAIQLSREKYCSVFATLRPDLDVAITFSV